MAVAKDAYPRDGQTQSYVVGFAEVEVDIETGVYTVEHYTALADVGTVLNPGAWADSCSAARCSASATS